MVNVLSLPDDLLGRLAYPEGWHDFQWWITLRLGFQAPEMGLTGPGERGLIDLNSNEGSVQACPDLIWEIPVQKLRGLPTHGGRDMKERTERIMRRAACVMGAGKGTLVLLMLAGAMISRQANAVDLPRNEAGVTGSFDTTLSVGAAVRTGDRDDRLIGLANGGSAYSINGDNGNLNYDKGDLVSTNVKVTHELLLEWKNFGFFGRAFYFYDHAVMNRETDRTPLSNDAEELVGRDIVLRDAYVSGDFDISGAPVSVRAGNQVMSWGESVFIRNGVNSINPVDASKFRIAGAELRDGLVPIPAINVKAGIGENLSFEAFYQLAWVNTEIEPEGTFFSTRDHVSPGGRFAHLGFGLPGRATDDPPGSCATPPICANVPRGNDREAGDGGQFGLALRYFSPALNGTEFGLYYARIHSRLPLVSGRTGTLAGVGAGDYAGTMRYFREFPEDIDIFGASFNTEIGATGFALQGEVSYRRDQPLQIDDVEILFSALSPLRNVPVPQLARAGAAFGQSQLGARGFDEEITGFRRKDVVQAQMAVSKILGPRLGADGLIFLVEVGFTHVRDMEDKSELRYDGPGTTTSANPFFTAAGIQPATQDGGFADPFSWGYRAIARATYNNAIGPVNLTPQVSFSHDVNGTAPAPIGNFVENRKTITLSIGANYLNSWRASISYTNSFDGGGFNLVNDRDYLQFAASYSF